VQELSSAVVLVTGAMASGKSTVAQLLAERLPRSVHLRGDSFRRMIVSSREEFTPPPTIGATAQLRLRYRPALRSQTEPLRVRWRLYALAPAAGCGWR
jgi:predicted kinase